ncbi:MAG: ABC transporter permease [Candidatus Taylorbacteria bacterium]
MKFHRINALLMRHLYLFQRSFPRIMDIFFWPVLELFVWGFLSMYLQKLNFTGVNIVTILLGAIIFWDLLNQAQKAVSVSFLEDVWDKNFLNIFVSPLRISEFLSATALIAIIKMAVISVVMGILAFFLYHFNIFQFGFYLIPFALNLLIFGFSLGLFTTAVILRYGTAAQILAFGFIILIQPFSAVFYPVSALPIYLQHVAYLLPSTYVFEGMRTVAATGVLPIRDLLLAFGANAVYLVVILWFFYRMFALVKVKGRLMKLD